MYRLRRQRGVVNAQGLTARSYVAALAMTMLTVVTILLLVGLRDAQIWVQHTKDVLTQLSNVLLDVRRMESAQRGFLLTHRTTYLEDYGQFSGELNGRLNDLANLVADNSEQTASLKKLADIVERKRAEMNSTIDLGRRGKFDQAVAIVMTDAGFTLMNDARKLVEQMNTTEERLLVERLKHVRQTFYLLVALMCLYIAISSGVLWQLLGKMRENLSARAQLQSMNQILEERVNERTKELLRRTEQLSRSNRELERFAYVASHDLQEPLRKIMMMTDLLEKPTANAGFMPRDRALAGIQNSAARMRELIDGILSLSRMSAEATLTHDVDLNALITELLSDDRLLPGSSQREFQIGPLPKVRANKTQIYRLFQNLIGNAVKFCKDGRPSVTVATERRGNDHIFFVKDNGIGIEDGYQERIFEVFERLHTKDAYPGSGLGLAICRKIVEGYGGTIWVESTPGVGSTFYFTLPRAVASADSVRL